MVTGYGNYSGKKGLGHRFGGCPVHQSREDRMEWSSLEPWGHQTETGHTVAHKEIQFSQNLQIPTTSVFFTPAKVHRHRIWGLPSWGTSTENTSFCTHVSSNCNIKPQLSKACGHLIIQKQCIWSNFNSSQSHNHYNVFKSPKSEVSSETQDKLLILSPCKVTE